MELNEKEVIINKGKKAAVLIADPVLQDCLATIKAKQLQKIQSSNENQQNVRENAYFTLKAVESLEIELNTMYSNGKIEESKIRKN